MSEIKANVVMEEITITKTYQKLTSLAVLNNHATDACRVQQENGSYIVLDVGQSVQLSAPVNTVLPDMTILTDATGLKAEIVAS
jgi:hypothetical protein